MGSRRPVPRATLTRGCTRRQSRRRWAVRLLRMDLLAPDVHRIAPEGNEPAKDRAPDGLASGTPEPLRGDLIRLLGADRVLTRVIDLIRYASDASPYRLLPNAVVVARDADEVAKVL